MNTYLNDNIHKSGNKLLYSHLSFHERKLIHIYLKQNFSIRKIASLLSRSPSTISREIKRNAKPKQPSIYSKSLYSYFYSYAHNQYINRRSFSKAKFKFNFFLEWFLQNYKYYLSFEQLKFNFIKSYPNYPFPTLKTIYNWFHSKLVYFKTQDVFIKKYKNKFKSRSKIKSIHSRLVNDYTSPAHYEINTIYNGKKLGGILTLNHRPTRMLFARIIKNREASTINKALRDIIINDLHFKPKTITSDNGKEFAFSKVIENSFNLDWYYCDPYSPSQRGQNERLNRDLRKFYLKGYNLTSLSKQDLDKTLNIINNFPRRVLHGLSALEKENELQKCNSL